MSLSTSNSTANETIARAFEKHALYSEFVSVKNQLSGKGFVCWVAGGAVRDFLIGRAVADFDLVTDATTDQIMQIFPQALTVGASFGVVKIVLKNKDIFDLATFRRESDYVDGRRPSQIDFATPQEDAGRRDFTINALFWDDQKKKVVDFTSGLKDIESKKLSCVGDADVRFQEDHLRILRLLRFSVQLGFECESETLRAALKRVQLLEKISGERIWAEFQKMIPYVKWGQLFNRPLADQIFTFLFGEAVPLISYELIDQVSLQASLQKFFFVLMTRYSNISLTKQVLKNRLKMGRDDLNVFDSLAFCYAQPGVGAARVGSMTYAEWAYEIEKNPLILDSLNFLSQVNEFNSELVHRLNALQANKPAKLIDGNDLLNQVEKQKIGDVLKKIRLLQFEQPLLTKPEILDLLQLKN